MTRLRSRVWTVIDFTHHIGRQKDVSISVSTEPNTQVGPQMAITNNKQSYLKSIQHNLVLANAFGRDD